LAVAASDDCSTGLLVMNSLVAGVVADVDMLLLLATDAS
jgi:hypothetical protein